jgi:hypothetical protein
MEVVLRLRDTKTKADVDSNHHHQQQLQKCQKDDAALSHHR